MSALQNMAGPQTMNDMSSGNSMNMAVNNVANDQMMSNNQSSVMIPNMSNMSHIQNINANQMNQNRVQNPLAINANRSEFYSIYSIQCLTEFL